MLGTLLFLAPFASAAEPGEYADRHEAAEETVGYRRPPPPPPPRRRPPPPPPAPMRVAPASHDVVLSIDALDAATGLADLTAELRLGRRGSAVLEGGLGASPEGALYTVGGEVRGYFAGNFDRGLFVALGADVGNAHLFLPVSQGVAIGPSVGAKYTFPIPITLQASFGADAVVTDDYRGVAPTANIGVGFAF